jgi:hypothetical protein
MIAMCFPPAPEVENALSSTSLYGRARPPQGCPVGAIIGRRPSPDLIEIKVAGAALHPNRRSFSNASIAGAAST